MKKYLSLLVLCALFSTHGIAHAGFWNQISEVFSPTLDGRKESLQEAINDFETKNIEANQEFTSGIQVFQETLLQAKEKDIDFKTLHDKWGEVEGRVENLENSFKKQVKKADLLFEEYYKRASTISDNVRKDILILKIDNTRDRYEKNFLKTKEKVTKLMVFHKVVQDKITEIEIIKSLSEIGTFITGLDELRIEAEAIMQELAKLNKEASNMLEMDVS